MALKAHQIEMIIALVKKGGMSNVQISKEVGCSESAVRTIIKKFEVEKNEINDLVSAEVQSIIIQNEIKKRKNEFNEVEKTMYDDILLTQIQSHNLAFNTNHLLLKKINASLEDGYKEDKINVGEGVQNVEKFAHNASDFNSFANAIQKTTDSLGITQRHAPKMDISNINATQNNNLTKAEISQAVAESLPD